MKKYVYDQVERIYQPEECGDKFVTDFFDGHNTFGTLIDRDGTSFPAIAMGSVIYATMHIMIWCEHAKAIFEYSDKFANYEYNYGSKKWEKKK